MEEIIYSITFFIYALFIIRLILSWIGGDFDMGGDIDLDISDIVSFKGFLHFLMGIFGWMSSRLIVVHTLMWYDYFIAGCVGIIFSVVLFEVYRFMMKLESKPTILSGKDLIGCSAKIDLQLGSDKEGHYYYNILVNNGVGTVQQDAISNNYYLVNKSVTIRGYNGYYYII